MLLLLLLQVVWVTEDGQRHARTRMVVTRRESVGAGPEVRDGGGGDHGAQHDQCDDGGGTPLQPFRWNDRRGRGDLSN